VTLCDNSKGLTQNNRSKKKQQAKSAAFFGFIWIIACNGLKNQQFSTKLILGLLREGAANPKLVLLKLALAKYFLMN
jgi:hypothetical protein